MHMPPSVLSGYSISALNVNMSLLCDTSNKQHNEFFLIFLKLVL